MFSFPGVHMIVTRSTILFPKLEAQYGWVGGPACRAVVDQISKCPGEVTTTLITEVGTAIVMYVLVLQDHCSKYSAQALHRI